MKPRILLCAALMAASLAFGFGPAMAQSTTATPTATPTPIAACSMSTLPNGNPAICATGAEEPPTWLGISGGNFNSVATDKSGNTTCSAGTFGALVQDTNGVQYVLSTNHVLARTSGTKGSAKANELIVQPGLVDLGCWQDTTDKVAVLSKWVSINFGKGVNEMDAAIAKVIAAPLTPGGGSAPGVDPKGDILNFVPSTAPKAQMAGQISTTPFNYNNIFDGLGVVKMGRTTCLTTGRVDAWDAMGVVVYPATNNSATSGPAFFDHQILIFGESLTNTGSTCTFADKGDSGALVVTQSDLSAGNPSFSCLQAVGMAFASSATQWGPDQGSDIVAVTPIQTILSKFNVTLVGQQCSAAAAGQPFGASSDISQPSAAFRISAEQVRRVKQAHARNLLRNSSVVAVGIGGGDTADTAALIVYLQHDTPAVRARVMRELSHQNIRIRFKHARRFHAL